jgi:hypothetical protein
MTVRHLNIDAQIALTNEAQIALTNEVQCLEMTLGLTKLDTKSPHIWRPVLSIAHLFIASKGFALKPGTDNTVQKRHKVNRLV